MEAKVVPLIEKGMRSLVYVAKVSALYDSDSVSQYDHLLCIFRGFESLRFDELVLRCTANLVCGY